MKPVCRRCRYYLKLNRNGDLYCPNCGEVFEKQGICFKCRRPLTRLHKNGMVYCAFCMEPLLRDFDSYSGRKYIKCPNPKCGYDMNINPSLGDRCPKCGKLLL